MIVQFSIFLICCNILSIENILEELGYTNPPFKIQLTWKERTLSGFIDGVLLLNTETNEQEEIYLDSQGRLIDKNLLNIYKIKEKNWKAKYVEFPPSCNMEMDKSSISSALKTKNKNSRNLDLLFPPPSSHISFPSLELWEEDKSDFSKGGKIIGKVKELDEKIELFGKFSKVESDTREADGMKIKYIGFFSANAVGMRLKLRVDSIPPQHRIFVKGELDNDINLVNFYNKEVWTPLGRGSTIYIYYVKPLSSSSDFSTVEVSAYASILIDPVTELTKIASCYEDVMCHTPWKFMSSGVVGLETISSKYIIFCTGSILTNNDPATVSNLVLTANHCVNSQSEAGALEFFWLYQSNECMGTIPSISTVPVTTGGADLLVTSPSSTGTDVTLLAMRNSPLQDIYEFGYTNYPIPYNTDVVVIHHPGSSYKRISFGETTNSGSPSYGGLNLQPLARFHEVKYYLSSTEAGSSGSPLIWASTGLVIGQLWGGSASCSLMNEPDYFGRFDVSFPILEPFLPSIEVNYDIDNSGQVDENDLNYVVDASLGIYYDPKCDLNKDGKYTALDIQLMLNYFSTD